jgi:hypothetical protein
MTKQNDQNNHPDFLHTAAGRSMLFAVVIIVVVSFAWRYVF